MSEHKAIKTMNKDKNKNKDDYYLNYLNADINDNGNESDNDSNFIPNEESSIEDMSMSQDVDTSQEDADADVDAVVDTDATVDVHVDVHVDVDVDVIADAIISPSPYTRLAEVSDDDSIVDVDLNENRDMDMDMDMDTADDADDEEDSESEKENKHNYSLRSAAAGSYLSMDATGNVVRSFSNIMRSLSHGGDEDEEDERSISSVPRTSLPQILMGTGASTNVSTNAHSAFLLQDTQEQDLSQDSSFLLPPPDATDYAPAEVLPPQQVAPVQQDILARLQASASRNTVSLSLSFSDKDKENETQQAATMQTNTNTNTRKETITLRSTKASTVTNMNTTRDEQDRLRAEEEDAATKLLDVAATAESPPPPQKGQNGGFLPADHYSHLLQAYEFVEDPSIPPLPPPPKEFVQSPTDENHWNASNQSPNTSYEDDIEGGGSVQDQEDSTEPRRRGLAGLFTIFSPPVPKKNNTDKSKDKSKAKANDGTPNTEPPTPTDKGFSGRGRQLFHSKNGNTSFDDGYEGEGDSSTGNRRKQSRKRRRFWNIVVVVLALICVAATSAIAYAMHLQFRNSNNNSTSAVVVDIAGNPSTQDEADANGENPGDSNNNNTDNELELVTTTPPFVPNASSLRPVTIKDPTNEPEPTAAPTNEGDFVGRLQDLLQTKNFVGPNGQLFVFDLSTNDSLNDPANLALVYLAREVAATMGLSSSSSSSTNFVPIHLKDYDDEKLVQRFALLALQFSASSSETTSNPFAGGDDKDEATDTIVVAEPMKRIVFQGDALADANDSSNGSDVNSSSNSNSNTPSQASEPIDPSTLADPNDARFLVDECDWEGVECASKDNTTSTSTIVTELRWDYRNLDGSIASTLGLLTALTSLDMSNNDLKGSIPESMYKLTDLEEIILFKNGLTGTISNSIGNLDKLKRFHLSHNSLAGNLPTELKSDGGSEDGIRPIEYFNVYSNQLTGTLPTDLRWRKCDYFDVGRNQIGGTLPDDIGDKFIALRHMFLDHNAFSGTFPSSYNTIGNGRLVVLAIESNQLSGVVPGEREIYDNLVQYTLHDNNFVGQEQQNCQNYLLVEFKADCPNVCTCFGRYFEFCERWCGVATPPYWQRQQQLNQQSRNWSF